MVLREKLCMIPATGCGMRGTYRSGRRFCPRMSSAVPRRIERRGGGAELRGSGEMRIRLTLSVIKADVGSVGGHTKPSSRMMATVEGEVAKAICNGLLIDGFICHTGDDIAIIMTRTRGEGSSEVHQCAWKAFLAATSVAKTSGLYGAGQDLLADAPSGNIRGAGPAVAELSFDHSLSGARPAESFMVFAADKCGPGAYNLPLYLAFADPMYCGGLMLPPSVKGFRFHVIDMAHTAGDSVIDVDAPADGYHIAALLRDNERFGIDRIVSRTHGRSEE